MRMAHPVDEIGKGKKCVRINDIAGHNLSVLAPCTLHRLKTLRNGIGNAIFHCIT